MIVRDEVTGEYRGIRCGHDECDVMAPPAAEILAGHGLVNMGWECHGGTHICPAHARPRDEWERTCSASISFAKA